MSQASPPYERHAPPAPGQKTPSDHRRAFYILDLMLLVCLNVASVLPVFSFKANGQTISLRWFMADASDLDSLHDALISQWMLTVLGLGIYLNQSSSSDSIDFGNYDPETGWPEDGTRGWVIGLSILSTLLALIPSSIILAFYLAYVRKDKSGVFSDISAPYGIIVLFIAVLPALGLLFFGVKSLPGRAKKGMGSDAKHAYKERLKVNARTIHRQVSNDVREALAFVSQEHSSLSRAAIGCLLLAALAHNVCASLPLFTWQSDVDARLDRRAKSGVSIDLGQNSKGRSAFFFFAFGGLPAGLSGIWSYGTLIGLGLLQLIAVWGTMAAARMLYRSRRLRVGFSTRLLIIGATWLWAGLVFVVEKNFYFVRATAEPKFPGVRLGWAVWFALIALVLITIAFLCSLADKYALAKSDEQMIAPNGGTKSADEQAWVGQDSGVAQLNGGNAQSGYYAQSQGSYAPSNGGPAPSQGGYALQAYGPQGGAPSESLPVYSQDTWRNEKTPAPGAYNQYRQQTPSQSQV